MILVEERCGYGKYRPKFGPSFSVRQKFKKKHARERCAVEKEFGITRRKFWIAREEFRHEKHAFQAREFVSGIIALLLLLFF